MLIWLFPAGIYLCFKELRDEHIFVILYGITASYFAGVMVRLMLTLTPIVCVCSGIAVSNVLDTYLDTKEYVPAEFFDTDKSDEKKGSGSSAGATSSKKKRVFANIGYFGILNFDSRMIVTVNMTVFLVIFVWHCTWVTSNAYSSPSIVLASRQADGSQYIIDDFREAYYWLRKNTKDDAKVMSWWDYGYQIAGMADRSTLVDNNTWNNTHIATVGLAMASNEELAYEIMQRHDVDYVLVIFGALLGYSGDDINKFLWMIRIGEGESDETRHYSLGCLEAISRRRVARAID
ncbi:hypothetical protein BC936DRAFT_136916 [Jimgerdemannia flammicorona]|uniref:dolichyl-diphosphooligosaccharide--protein glycotransferase n=1 Tax=Jimgerdemannia flammicorona TaxID=994334 RepID=A0A433CYH8_9FUNG|nr:hypothetical protein BC936DRAFT_136916 [Jimgerdemannia flammicorona]